MANLWNFKQFYIAFPEDQKVYTLRRELTWSHYRLIMRLDNPGGAGTQTAADFIRTKKKALK